MNERISVMIPHDLKRDLEMLLKEKKVDQSTLIRQLLYQSVRKEKIKYALEAYNEEKVSFGKAAEIAGVSIWELLDAAHRHNVGLKYTLSDAEKEIEKIRKGAYDEFISK